MPGISVTEYFRTIIINLNEGLGELCAVTGCHILSGVVEAVEDPDHPFTLIPRLTHDGAHLTFEGYERLGRAIVRTLREWGCESGSRVLLVGDSITAGYPEYEPLLLGPGYGDERHSFGYLIRTMLTCTVINCGISGDLTSSMVSRLPVHLREEPDMVILQGGANDAYHSIEMREHHLTRAMAEGIAASILSNFRRMIEICRERDIRCAVIPLLPFYDGSPGEG